MCDLVLQLTGSDSGAPGLLRPPRTSGGSHDHDTCCMFEAASVDADTPPCRVVAETPHNSTSPAEVPRQRTADSGAETSKVVIDLDLVLSSDSDEVRL